MSIKALVSLLLGVLSFVFSVVAGIPAVWLGILGLREVNESDGRLKGRIVALAGMALGTVGSAATLLGFGALILLHMQANAQRLGCANNLGQIGIGLSRYRERTDTFPPGTIANPDLSPERRLSWLVALLPSIERVVAPPPGKQPGPPWYEAIDQRQAWNADANRQLITRRVPGYRCPGEMHRPPPNAPGPTNYVGCAGVGAWAATLAKENPQAGFFGYDRTIDLADITRGISNTMSVLETAFEIGPWAAGGYPTVRPIRPGEEPYCGYGRPFGGLHPGGLNVLFADNSVRFVSDQLQPQTLEHLSTIHGEQAENGP
jgi:prepilin-type processing-associated H-X9-DG protein